MIRNCFRASTLDTFSVVRFGVALKGNVADLFIHVCKKQESLQKDRDDKILILAFNTTIRAILLSIEVLIHEQENQGLSVKKVIIK